jgi:hypothetical protein
MATKVKVHELRCGDRVRLFEGAYGDATVVQAEIKLPEYEGARPLQVKLWRPYMMTSDVMLAGGNVIPSIGLEIVVLHHGEREIDLIEREKWTDISRETRTPCGGK